MKLLLNLFLIVSLHQTLAAYNVVLIIADDLDSELDGMTPLPMTGELIGNQGATFLNSFVASPICCPNRASILTGKYQHNHRTVNNTIAGGCSSPEWQRTFEPNTFGAYLKREMNYATFYAGKYLNKYGSREAGGVSHVPAGWDNWFGLVGNSKYYDYSLSINGREKKYGHNPETDYLTDVIRDFAVKFINRQRNSQNPFLMVLAPPAPHSPFLPASRHNDKYKGKRAVRTPSFNIGQQKRKHWLVRMGPSPLPNHILPILDETYRRRWETLAAVDDLVSKVYTTLKNNNLLNNTYIIFTSDNGYHIGQFSMPLDKRQPYETDIKVPLLIRGPGISPTSVIAPVSSVDLFDTILKIAGVEHPSDGVSILSPRVALDRTLLVEYKGEKSKTRPQTGCPSDGDLNLSYCSSEFACKCEDVWNNTYACIRRVSPHHNNIFCIFEDDEKYVEAYDLHEDRYQLDNIGYTMKRNRRHRFRRRLKDMMTCEGSDCVRTGPDT
ncbi:N-acetylglucosamine-6-sulfatase-like [Venturia canescens]|uniref:N-acetylglucosamine-6-sulfatase-like n=1 Tax=Venturia canescens TaxID=32260 RepID=UPI001C9CEABB|nr:N-acetylglucosamine-6-sulfatase-like [Venturia canescens]XP_043277080.1 N-acetylglucosamine-6-sulfatase-like [Venturia canescens]